MKSSQILDRNSTWKQVLSALRAAVSPSEFRTWLSPLALAGITEKDVVIHAPNKFVATWVADHYIEQIRNGFKNFFDLSPAVRFEYPKGEPAARLAEGPKTESASEGAEEGFSAFGHKLDPLQSFDSFVTHDTNRFAFALAKEVAQHPGSGYNPLYIFSPLAVGKTHLLNATAVEATKINPEAEILFLEARRFCQELGLASRSKRLDQFRERFYDLDMLLLDDIDCLESREVSQREIIRLLDHFQQSGKQIVLSAKMPPNQIENLTDELSSRFQSGVLAQILMPELELKMEILRQKSLLSSFHIPEDVAFFLSANAKDLKTLLQHFVALQSHASLGAGPIEMSTVRTLINRNRRFQVTLAGIQNLTADYFRLSVVDLLSESKKREIAYPRQVAMFLARKWTPLSFKDIGKAFANKDHSTVVYAVQKIDKKKHSHGNVLDDIRKIEALLF